MGTRVCQKGLKAFQRNRSISQSMTMGCKIKHIESLNLDCELRRLLQRALRVRIRYLTVLVKHVPYLQKEENMSWRCASNLFVSNHQCASTCSIYVEGSAIFQLLLGFLVVMLEAGVP